MLSIQIDTKSLELVIYHQFNNIKLSFFPSHMKSSVRLLDTLEYVCTFNNDLITNSGNDNSFVPRSPSMISYTFTKKVLKPLFWKSPRHFSRFLLGSELSVQAVVTLSGKNKSVLGSKSTIRWFEGESSKRRQVHICEKMTRRQFPSLKNALCSVSSLVPNPILMIYLWDLLGVIAHRQLALKFQCHVNIV